MANEPDPKNPQVAPKDALTYLMAERGVTQYRLAKDGIVSRGALHAILTGKRGMSKAVAKKLAAYFNAPVELFVQPLKPYNR